MSELREMIVAGFPKEKKGMPSHLQEYWNLRNRLHIINGVILLQDEETMRSDLVNHFNSVSPSILSIRNPALITCCTSGNIFNDQACQICSVLARNHK